MLTTVITNSRLQGEYLLIKNIKIAPPFPLDKHTETRRTRLKFVTSQNGPNYRKQTMSYSNVQILSALIFSNVRVLLIVNMDVIK